MSLVSLGVVCLIVFATLRLLGRRGLGRGLGPIRIRARCPLEPRRALYLVETAGRCFLVGVGDGPMTMLAEIATPPEATSSADVPSPLTRTRFSDVLGRVLGRDGDAGPA